EAYLRVVGRASAKIQDRAHFFAVAAHVMRRILVDYARSRAAKKRGGPYAAMEWDDSLVAVQTNPDQVLEIDRVMRRLSRYDPRKGRMVEMNVFAALTDAEVG